LGIEASNRMNEDLGRLFGSGTTRPALVRCRATVARETVISWWWAKCHTMVSGPASRPVVVSFSRSSTMRFSTSTAVELGLDLGRLERGSKAASPSRR
jgi:hypothetical protein